MSVSSAFLWRFLDDVWDLLPTEDRELFQSYWSAQLQIAANLEQKAIEAALSTEVSSVPVFLTERWNRFRMNEDTCDLFQATELITLSMSSEVPLSRETAFYDTVSVSNASRQIYHEETIQFFDDSVRELMYGKIVAGTISVSIYGYSKDWTNGTITATDKIVKTGAFADAEEGMTIRVTAATPGTPIGLYTIRAILNPNEALINEDFGVAAATGVDFTVESQFFEYTQGRDYAVNREEGTIQALLDGRIPPTELLRIRYRHEEYLRGSDFELDEIEGTVARIPSGNIPDGAEVAVSYTYNGTATLAMEGTKGSVDFATLIDNAQDFSTLLPNRTLTIKSGPNAGTYQINAVVSPHEIQITTTFPSVQETDVVYSINAFPHGVKVDKNIESIPVLQDLVDMPTSVFIEGVDFVVSNGILSVRSPFLLSQIGPEDTRERQAWAQETKIDDETPYRNFGVLIDFYRKNSEEYKLALQGLWFTFWTGSTPGNLQRGLHILIGLPFARSAGKVTRVDTSLGEIDVTDSRGQTLTYVIPSGLDPAVARWESVERFQSLTTGVQIIDRNNEPGFVANRLGRSGIAQFLTSNATKGVGNTDETKALKLLEHHLFLPQILTEAITRRVNVGELVTFLENMKPKNTHYVFSFAVEESESVFFSEDLPPPELTIDLSTTIGGNPINRAAAESNFTVQSAAALPVNPPATSHTLIPVQRTTGRILAGGTQATGNFRDSGIDFADLGIDRGDYVRIDEGLFLGAWEVLKRISGNLLSLSIPDAMITGVSNIDYVVFPQERMLDIDAVNVGREHVKKAGTEYFVPTTLNTKSDIDLAGSTLRNEDVKALLLIDIGISGAEVQAITDADVENDEFDVATPPAAPVTRDHEMASAALKRTNNTGPTVTHAFAI